MTALKKILPYGRLGGFGTSRRADADGMVLPTRSKRREIRLWRMRTAGRSDFAGGRTEEEVVS